MQAGSVEPGDAGAALALVAPNIAAPAMAITDRMRSMCAPFSHQFVMEIERRRGRTVPRKRCCNAEAKNEYSTTTYSRSEQKVGQCA
jgi:hypothetical protein